MGGIATQLHRQLDDLLVTLRDDPDGLVGPRGSAGRAALRGMLASLQAARALVSSAIGSGAKARAHPLAGPLAGVVGGDAAESLSHTFVYALVLVALPDATTTGVAGSAAPMQ